MTSWSPYLLFLRKRDTLFMSDEAAPLASTSDRELFGCDLLKEVIFLVGLNKVPLGPPRQEETPIRCFLLPCSRADGSEP